MALVEHAGAVEGIHAGRGSHVAVNIPHVLALERTYVYANEQHSAPFSQPQGVSSHSFAKARHIRE